MCNEARLCLKETSTYCQYVVVFVEEIPLGLQEARKIIPGICVPMENLGTSGKLGIGIF